MWASSSNGLRPPRIEYKGERELRLVEKDDSIIVGRHGSIQAWQLEQEAESLHPQLQAQSSKRERGRERDLKLEGGEAFCSQSQSLSDVLPPARLCHLNHPPKAPLTGDQVSAQMPNL